ncbi:MAG: hypothetical protein BGO78_09415 [Chloroflexi bacterium 44-23]|nr:MAG: hypothetical protein BGO78_09415 [Chloroflexi bacterium 44-23]
MPRLSVWTVRFSLIYLFLGFTFGALMLAQKGVPFAPWVWSLFPAHIDILLFGFVIQFAMGIAFWILPRYSGGSRGNETSFYITIGLLNLGIWIAALVGSFNLAGDWLAVGNTFKGIAALFFAVHAWGRIRHRQLTKPGER